MFHQILDALVHMSSLGIVSSFSSVVAIAQLTSAQIHRDIKLTNIFVGECLRRFRAEYEGLTNVPDAKGDCKGAGSVFLACPPAVR